MTYSALTDTRTNTRQKSSRQGARVDTILLHHMAGTDAAGVVRLMETGQRQVSANYAIGRDGHAWGVVPEEERAWTSGSSTDGGRGAAWDRRSITFEIADEVAGDAHGWPISAASFEKVARMMADIASRYGIPLDRDHVLGHRELWTRYRASYSTACPGGLDLDAITARARAIQAGGDTPPTQTPQEDNDMPVLELVKEAGDPTGTVWLCRDRMERRAVSGADFADTVYFVGKVAGEDAAKTKEVRSLTAFGVDLGRRELTYEYITNGGKEYVSFCRSITVQVDGDSLADYRFWLGKRGYALPEKPTTVRDVRAFGLVVPLA